MNKLGLSGDKLSIVNKTIIKTCHTNQERFINNISKQFTFINPYLRSVDILYHGLNEDGRYYAVMPFLQYQHPLLWLNSANTTDINNVCDIIYNYLNYIINNSQLLSFDYIKWYGKIDELLSKIEHTEMREILKYLKKINFMYPCYMGNCHGDFTLSNLFITNEKQQVTIELFDFLGSFIESPLIDIVKIRQDTKHLWSLHLMNINNIDYNKIIIVLNYLDNKLSDMIISNPILQQYYTPLQLINLLRIIPYSKSNYTTNYLYNEIQKLFKEFI